MGATMRRVRWVVVWLLVALVGGGLGTVTAHLASVGGALTPPVQVLGVELGGLTRAEFDQRLAALERQLLASPRLLQYEERWWSLEAERFRVRLDRDAMWEAAAAARPDPGLRGWLSGLWARLQGGIPLPVQLRYDRAALQRFLQREVGPAIYAPPQNAFRNPRTGVIHRERWGRALDVAVTEQRLLAAWSQPQEGPVPVAVMPIPPATTTAEVEALVTPLRLTSFSTNFDPSQRGRVHNIRLAASIIDYLILMPGEVFSFNDIVGPRTLERGFQEAPELINGDLVPGIGGGICQVSSTLYNAVLLAGLEVVTRRNHSRPLGYVPLGRDATVYYDAIDFRFRNTLPHPVLIRAAVEGSQLQVSLWGRAPLPARYEVRVENVRPVDASDVRRPDPSLRPGQEVRVRPPRPGYRAEVYRVTRYRDGRTRRELISRDYYPPQDGLVRVGAPAPAPQPTPVQGGAQAPPGEAAAGDKPRGGAEASPPSQEGRGSLSSGSPGQAAPSAPGAPPVGVAPGGTEGASSPGLPAPNTPASPAPEPPSPPAA